MMGNKLLLLTDFEPVTLVEEIKLGTPAAAKAVGGYSRSIHRHALP